MKKIAILSAALLSVMGVASSALALPAALQANIGVSGPGGLADSVIVGERLDATNGYDNALDTISIGAGMGRTYLLVSIPHPEYGKPKDELKHDNRSIKAQEEWIVTVTTNLPAATTMALRLMEDSVVPGEYQLWFEDLETGATADLGAGAYEFSVAAPDVARSFRIVATRTATAPEPPTMGKARAGSAKAVVSFSAPAFDGGSPVLEYVVTSSPGGVTATGVASPIMVTGLRNGKTYTFTVQAVNAAGLSAPSEPSNKARPKRGAEWKWQPSR